MNINKIAEDVIRAAVETINEEDIMQEVYDDYAEVIRRIVAEKIGDAVCEIIDEKLKADDILPF